MNILEAYLKGLSGMHKLLRPYHAKFKPHIQNNFLSLTAHVDAQGKEYTFELKQAPYWSVDSLHSNMWSFSEWIWEQIYMEQKRKTYGKT